MAAATTLYESNICRLCSAECDDGADLFDAENSPHRLELIINHYLPVQVRKKLSSIKRVLRPTLRGFVLNRRLSAGFEMPQQSRQ